MSFTLRERELKLLNQYYESNESKIVVLYGQKLIGKSELLKDFCHDKNYYYYKSRSCSDKEQRSLWRNEMPSDAKEGAEDISYQEIFSRISDFYPNERMIVILDEFQYLVKGDPDFFADLLRFLQTAPNPVFFLLVSHASGWIENSLIGKIGPLSASISGFIKIKEYAIHQIMQIFPGYTEYDYAVLYSVLGGVPGLWRMLDPAMSAEDNIKKRILDKNSRLFTEMTAVLEEELREPAVYNTILNRMANGSGRLNELFAQTGFSRAKISVYLKNLMEIDVVEKTGSGSYRIARPFVRFYFCFVYPHFSHLEELSRELYYIQYMEEPLSEYVRKSFQKD